MAGWDPKETHPLVTALAKAAPKYRAAVTRFEKARKALKAGREPAEPAEPEYDVADLPTTIAFAGFLAGQIKHMDELWWLMYTDAVATKWLVVRDEDTASFECRDDENAPEGYRNVVWVYADGVVGVGKGRVRTNEARFLTGVFTRACDFGPTPTGGTLAESGTTGIFCEARTPSCCGPRSYTR